MGWNPSVRDYDLERTCIFGQGSGQVPICVWKNAQGEFQFGSPASPIAADCQFTFTLGAAKLAYGGTAYAEAPMPAVGEMKSLFQNYQISKVEITFMWSCDAYNAETSLGGASPPLIIYAVDQDDGLGATFSDVLQYQNVRKWYPNGTGSLTRSVAFRPKCKELIWSGGGVTGIQQTGYNDGENFFISTDNTDIPHYGIKMAGMLTAGKPVTENVTPRVVGFLTVSCKYFIRYRDLK